MDSRRVLLTRSLRYPPASTSPRERGEVNNYAALPFASWIARHTRSGVNGMSMCLMP